jgi:hypothetical protein
MAPLKNIGDLGPDTCMLQLAGTEGCHSNLERPYTVQFLLPSILPIDLSACFITSPTWPHVLCACVCVS